MLEVFIMRGIPGAGKSSIMKKLAMEITTTNLYSVSADYYFEDINTGEYKFDPALLEDAHSECLRQFMSIVMFQSEASDAVVFVDNTNMMLWQMSPYVSIAKAYGCPITFVEVYCDIEIAWKRNIHNVPLSSIERMCDKYEILPLHWLKGKQPSQFWWVDNTNFEKPIWQKHQ